MKGLDLDKCTMLNITFRDTGSIDVASSGPLEDADMLKINFFLSSLFYSVRGSEMMEMDSCKRWLHVCFVYISPMVLFLQLLDIITLSH